MFLDCPDQSLRSIIKHHLHSKAEETMQLVVNTSRYCRNHFFLNAYIQFVDLFGPHFLTAAGARRATSENSYMEFEAKSGRDGAW